MVGKESSELLDFLGRSRCRVIILSELVEDGPLDREYFNRLFNGSRTTLTRNLDSLIDRELIERENRTYRLTPKGTYVAEELLELIKTIRATSKLNPILAHVPPTEFDFEPHQLTDATIIKSKPSEPYAPVDKHISRLEAADQVRCLLPLTGINSMKTAERRVLNGDAEYELVVDSRIAEKFRSDSEYSEMLNQMLATGQCTVYTYEGTFPYYLGLLDDVVQIGVSDEGMPRALLEARSDQVRKCAEEIYNKYRNESIPF
jgi:predicted transcriptional regulator